ncbi:MAG: cbb3-type cytochrome oxidase assembly protein CcoS [Ignavibacteriaceae bacterium]|nr:cbb3-type cytochrome oxidase assembly protein CcoS [Ignavibacteriaceae bacterium]
MSVIVLLIIVSVLVAGGFLTAFIISVRRGQFSDQTTPAIRMLLDDIKNEKPVEKTKGELNAR